MTEQKQQLEQQLWIIANTLRGKMDADDFRDYILGFIFYKYLSTKMELYANEILEPDNLKFRDIEGHAQEVELLEALRDAALDKLGYFLLPSELFSELAKRGNAGGKNQFILGDLAKVLTHIEQSTMGSESEEDFGLRAAQALETKILEVSLLSATSSFAFSTCIFRFSDPSIENPAKTT